MSADELQATRATAWREACWWCLSQIPVALVVLAVAIVILVALRKPWPALIGGAGLAVSTLAAYWLASSLFPSDQELREMDTIGGLNRSPAAMRERAKATIATGVLVVGFVLQYVSLMLPSTPNVEATVQRAIELTEVAGAPATAAAPTPQPGVVVVTDTPAPATATALTAVAVAAPTAATATPSPQQAPDPIWVTALATVLAGVATTGTMIAALVQINTERRRRHESEQRDRRERHVAQARLIAAVANQQEHPPDERDATAVDLINTSQEPVYRLVVGIVFIQGAAPHSIEDFLKLSDGGAGPVSTVAILPGGTFRVWIPGRHFEVMMGRVAAELAFVDREGTSWIRRASGKLEELPKEPLEYFQQWGLHGPYELQVPERT